MNGLPPFLIYRLFSFWCFSLFTVSQNKNCFSWEFCPRISENQTFSGSCLKYTPPVIQLLRASCCHCGFSTCGKPQITFPSGIRYKAILRLLGYPLAHTLPNPPPDNLKACKVYLWSSKILIHYV